MRVSVADLAGQHQVGERYADADIVVQLSSMISPENLPDLADTAGAPSYRRRSAWACSALFVGQCRMLVTNWSQQQLVALARSALFVILTKHCLVTMQPVVRSNPTIGLNNHDLRPQTDSVAQPVKAFRFRFQGIRLARAQLSRKIRF